MHWLGEQCRIVGQIMDSMSNSFHVFYRTMVHIEAAMVRSHPRHLNHRIPVYVLSNCLSRSVYYSKTTWYPKIVPNHDQRSKFNEIIKNVSTVTWNSHDPFHLLKIKRLFLSFITATANSSAQQLLFITLHVSSEFSNRPTCVNCRVGRVFLRMSYAHEESISIAGTYDHPLSQHFQYYNVEPAFENLWRKYVFNYRNKANTKVCL
jgi:hypothetical protein